MPKSFGLIYRSSEASSEHPAGAYVSDLKIDLRKELLGRVKREFIEALDRDEQAAVEAAIGEMGNKSDAVKLGWLRMRTKESWTKQRYTITVGRAFEKLRKMVEAYETAGGDGDA